jgi:sec-independent protein translocase protein TatC
MTGNKIARISMMEQNKVSEQVKDPESQSEGESEQFNAQSLTDHLRDLRSCLLLSLAAIIVGFAASYGYIESIGVWFFKPLTDVLPEGSSLIFTSYQEGFFFI